MNDRTASEGAPDRAPVPTAAPRLSSSLVGRVAVGGLRAALRRDHVDDLGRVQRSPLRARGLGAARARCGGQLRAGPLSSRETVLELVPRRRLTYEYRGSLPFAEYRGEVRLSPQRGGIRLEWRAEFTAKHALSGPALVWLVERILARLTRRRATAAEAS